MSLRTVFQVGLIGLVLEIDQGYEVIVRYLI
jgi:hypothetical protein